MLENWKVGKLESWKVAHALVAGGPHCGLYGLGIETAGGNLH